MKFKHFETESGKTITTAQFDGYEIAERTLEGMMFQISIQEDGSLKAFVKPEDEDWFDQFNTTKWLKEATEYAEKCDEFEDPISGEACWLVADDESVKEDKSLSQPIPISINSNTLSQLANNGYAISETEDVEAEEIKDPVIGEFKTKDRFIEFIGAKGNFNFISNEAIIDAKYLSGLDMDGISFKLTICDEGTVNFDEIETTRTTKEQRSRLLDIISEKTITPFRQRMVVQELQFKSTKNVGDVPISLYLSVEYQKPIEKLVSIFDTDEQVADEQVSSKLDTLLSLFDEDDDNDIKDGEDVDPYNLPDEEHPSGPVIIENKTQIEESFAKMKQEKIDDLTKRLDNKRKELVKFSMDSNLSQKKVSDAEAEIVLLESRLDNLSPNIPSNGYYFFVSERLNEEVNLDPEIEKIIRDRVSKIKSINTDAFMKIFENGEYQIKLGTKSLDTVIEVSDFVNLADDVKKSLGGLSIRIDDGKLIYTGDLNWGDIVNKMIKCGFTQDPQFDKDCGSNSYAVNTPPVSPIDNINVSNLHRSLQDDVETVVECKLKEISNPDDIRITLYNKFGKNIPKYHSTCDIMYDLADEVENWPKISTVNDDGEIDDLEQLDCENCSFTQLDSKKIVVSAGGDWQSPLTMTIESEGGKLYVTSFEFSYDEDGISMDYMKEQISISVVRDERISTIIDKK